MKKLTLMLSLLLLGYFTNAQIWTSVGSPGFSPGATNENTIAIDGSGTTYVAYFDVLNGGRVTVMKYIGGSWVTVGSPGFSPDYGADLSIAIDGSGTPYIAYMDAISYTATVMRYNGSSWALLGTGFTATIANTLSFTVSSSGIPYIAYDYIPTAGMTIGVMKYYGGSWVAVGSPIYVSGVGPIPKIVCNSSGTPYVSYIDYSSGGRVSVRQYSAGSWVYVGSAGFSSIPSGYPTMAIDAAGTPYVVYGDNSYGGRATAMKYNGTGWVPVGSPGFSGPASYPLMAMAIDGTGTPYVLYSDSSSTRPTIMKYSGGFWGLAGNAGCSAGPASNSQIAIDPSGVPYIGYRDVAYGCRATVLRLLPCAPISIGATITNASCYGMYNGSISTTVSGGYIPYTWLWSTGATTSGISVQPAGVYAVSVTDANGCSATGTYTIKQPDLLDITAVVINASCFKSSDGKVTAMGIGGTAPYTYLWSNGATTSYIYGLTAGTYSVTITDAHGCTATRSYTVTQPDAIFVYGTVTNLTKCTAPTGRITTTVTGGNPAYTYTWSNGASGVTSISGLYAGTYSLAITDTKGCTGTNSWTVTCPHARETGSQSGTETENISIPNSGFAIYPNPTNGAFSIELPGPAENVEIVISDLAGRTIEKRTVTEYTGSPIHCKLSDPAAGMYILEVVENGTRHMGKIIVQ